MDGISDDLIREGETLDELRRYGLRILQARGGYRFSLDPLLLCAFARLGSRDRVVDLGTGSGVMALLLARQHAEVSLLGIEHQADLAERARRNVCLNGLEERVRILHADVRALRQLLPAQSADAVLCNPPFRCAGSGRRSPRDERDAARFELSGGLEDFLTAAAWLLGDGGRLFIIHLAERLVDLFSGLRALRLEPKRLRCVQGGAGEAARLVMVEARKGAAAGLAVLPPLVTHEDGEYSAELRSLYDC